MSFHGKPFERKFFRQPFPRMEVFRILMSRTKANWAMWLSTGSLAEEYNLEQQYRKPFLDVWKEEKDNRVFGPLSERMGVRGSNGGELLVSDEEMEAASKCRGLSCSSLSGCVLTRKNELLTLWD